jgi:hypothetical protein
MGVSLFDPGVSNIFNKTSRLKTHMLRIFYASVTHISPLLLISYATWNASIQIRGTDAVGEASVAFTVASLGPFIIMIIIGLATRGIDLHEASEVVPVKTNLVTFLTILMWSTSGWASAVHTLQSCPNIVLGGDRSTSFSAEMLM